MTKESVIENFKWSVQALALPAEIQIKLFPDFVVVADELVLEYDAWMDVLLRNFKIELTREQLFQIEKLNELIDNIPESTSKVSELEVLQSDSFYIKIRTKASEVLAEFSWQLEEPPFDRIKYIKS